MDDLFTAADARDAALAKVTKNNEPWMIRAMRQISVLPSGEYTGEDIRLRLSELMDGPTHHNAWGALIMNAVKKHILIDTGRVSRMKGGKSHARKTSIYRKS